MVITRVTPSMLPPTIITAPTSDAARPNPASAIVTSENRKSQSSVGAAPSVDLAERAQLLAILRPRVLDDLSGERGQRWER